MNRLSNGQELRDPRTDQPVWRVINAMPIDQGIKLYSFSEKTEKYVSLRKIHDSIIASDLVVYDHRQAKIPLVDQQAPKLIKQLQVANAHLCAIDEMQRSADITTKRAWSILYDEHIRSGGEPEAFPGLSTTYRYIERRRHNLGLVKGDANKGNRTHRYSEEVQALAIKIIQENYLKEGSSDTRKTILREVNDEMKALGLLPGGKEVGKKYLASLIRMMTMDEEVHRMDPKNVLSARSRGTQRLKVSSVFQRYEQDALHLPFVVKTAHGISSNVWVVHAIDCGASMPVSWKMVIGNPRETDTMKCIERFLYSKRDLFLGLGINANWDCEGTPAMLIFDNGSENKGDRVEQLPRLNMGVMHCKARAGHGKPFIERLNRSLKEGLERLPGCTRMHGKDGTRDPVKLEDKLMSVEELEKWLVNWYYKVWANTKLKRLSRTAEFTEDFKLGVTPRTRWKSMVEDVGICSPLPPSTAEWQKVLYTRAEGTLNNKTGITWERMNYKGQVLNYLLDRHGENKVPFYYDKDDYRYIYVDDGPRNSLVRLVEEFVEEHTAAFSFDDIKRIHNEQDVQEAEHPEQFAFRRAVSNAAKEGKKGPAKTSKARKSRVEQNRDVTHQTRNAEAVQRAKDRPHKHELGGEQTSTKSVAGQDSDESVLNWDDIKPLPVKGSNIGESSS